MRPVTDPALLAELESKPVTDPALLARLEGKSNNSMMDVVRNAAAEGIAGIPDMFLNAPNRLKNLAQIPYGLAVTAAGRADLAPDMAPDPDLVRNAAVNARVIEPSVVPTGAQEKVIDALVRGGVGGLLTAGVGGAGMGAASSLAATGAQEATGSPLAGVAAGLAVPGGAAGYSAATKTAAPWLMGSALKPSARAVKSGDARAAIQTLLDEGINANKGGAVKLDKMATALDEQITNKIAQSSATVGKNEIAAYLDDVTGRFKLQVDPASDLAAIRGVRERFMNNESLPKVTPAKTTASAILDDAGRPFTQEIPASGTDRIPVQLAQDIKRGTYRALGDKAYGELKGAEIEAQKALARGAKDEIGRAVPDVVPLNARESALLNAKKLVEHRAAVDANKNPIGLGALPSTGARTVAFLADRSALVKSLLARALNSSGKAAGNAGAKSVIPLSFQEDAMQRQAIIDALMGR